MSFKIIALSNRSEYTAPRTDVDFYVPKTLTCSQRIMPPVYQSYQYDHNYLDVKTMDIAAQDAARLARIMNDVDLSALGLDLYESTGRLNIVSSLLLRVNAPYTFMQPCVVAACDSSYDDGVSDLVTLQHTLTQMQQAYNTDPLFNEFVSLVQGISTNDVHAVLCVVELDDRFYPNERLNNDLHVEFHLAVGVPTVPKEWHKNVRNALTKDVYLPERNIHSTRHLGFNDNFAVGKPCTNLHSLVLYNAASVALGKLVCLLAQDLESPFHTLKPLYDRDQGQNMLGLYLIRDSSAYVAPIGDTVISSECRRHSPELSDLDLYAQQISALYNYAAWNYADEPGLDELRNLDTLLNVVYTKGVPAVLVTTNNT